MKKISKILLITLIICLLLAFAACPDNNPTDGEPNGGDGEGISMKVTVGSKEFTATLYDTAAAKAFAEMLPLTINMTELNGNEKYHNLSTTLPTKSENVGKINAGDIMLWGNNCIVLFYKNFSTSYSYTKIGKLDDVTGLQQAVGSGSVTVTFSLQPKDFNC